MKSVLLFLALVSALPAFADGFDIIKDGVTYRCEAGSVTDPGIVLDCANKAYAGPFSRDEATQLCQSATSVAPADCGIKAYSGIFSRNEAIQLCIKAKSLGPTECAAKAYNGPFNRAEAIDLCKGNGSIANADCAIKAYNGPYSKEEAIRICKIQPELILRSLRLIEETPELRSRVKAIKSKLQ